MPILAVRAPFDGWCTTLEDVPDPVFAGRMLGDGLAIDPLSGVVIAPCGGEIVTVAKTGHSVVIRTPGGSEVLVHVGIDTVGLGGRGFDLRVGRGAQVRAAEEIMRFDLDVVARGAKSLLTPIVVTPQAGMRIVNRRSPGPIAAGDLLYEISGTPAVQSPAQESKAGTAASVRQTHRVELQQGLHARPAASLAQFARNQSAEISLSVSGRHANARSVVAIMALGVSRGDEITIEAQGPQAQEAVDGIVAALADALRAESAHRHALAPHGPDDPPVAVNTSAPDAASVVAGALRGIVAVPGFAVGRVVRIAPRELLVTERGSGRSHESEQLARALAAVRNQLARVAERGGNARREILSAHGGLLGDPLLRESAEELIAVGKSAGFAWRGATRRAIAALEQLDNPRLRERADDLRDVEAQVLRALEGELRPTQPSLPEQAVLIADELLPSELTALDADRLSAIALSRGGATSHVAILAAALDVPMLIGLGAGIRALAEGVTVIVDAERGLLQIAPSAAELDAAAQRVATRQRQRQSERLSAHREAVTSDGVPIEVFANLGSIADAVGAVANGAEGCGLLRTEFLFIDRDDAPDEAEQLDAYQAIATALAGRPLVLRLMDVGGDKPLRYLPLPEEQNPALGLRGVRTALARPDLLRTQLRAALRVEPSGTVQILVPMVTDLGEIQAIRAAIAETCAALGRNHAIRLGAMIETPAAALTAGHLLSAVDFVSIGSNDLTQYTLAMDRGHVDLAGRADALHPAVLRLIAATGTAGAAADKLVAVCGGAAADPLAVPLLIGLGVRELSVVPAAVPAIKRRIRTLSAAACRDLALRCLEAASAADVRAMVMQVQTKTGEAP